MVEAIRYTYNETFIENFGSYCMNANYESPFLK